jgi:hypothetical protein
LTWHDVVATYERVMERPVPLRFVAAGEEVPGLPDPMPDLLAGMETYDTVVETEDLARTFDVPLTTLETFVREQTASRHG